MSYQFPAKQNPWYSPPSLQYVARMNPDGFDSIRPGDRVTIRDRFGSEHTGRMAVE